jgi:ATP-dependent helicase HrpB
MDEGSSRAAGAAATAPLPIDPVLPAVLGALDRGRRVVLRAPPGAGKTTRVPPALLDAGVAGARCVLVLEPRRIAARAAADFVARIRGGAPGGDVGYRVRFERRGGAATRLWFVTEGVFGRHLGDDPFLDDVGVVVLDEFHERHLQGDLALAVVRALQQTVRPDLKLVVMSATLATDALARHLPDATVVTSEGRAHPVAIDWAPPSPGARPAAHVAAVVRDVLRGDAGDVLVFLPGAGEIRRTAGLLADLRDVDVVMLHGDQPLDEQQRALRAGPRRRVILATNVAETALTVEGVATVVDAGLARVARFDPRHGIDRLVVAPISRAAAEQRAGRAGRLGPGRCVRLWSREEHAGRRRHETPEILRCDLTRTVLELRAWGLEHADRLPWLDAPPRAALAHAEQLLVQLGAADAASGAVTPLGRRILALPAAPRLARMQLETERLGAGPAGATLAALAGERDVLRAGRALGHGAADRPAGPSDLLVRLELFEEAGRRGFSADACRLLELEPRAVRTVERTRRQLARHLSGGGDADPERLLQCVLAGFPDRVCHRRAPGSDRAVMVGGGGVALAADSVVREAELFVAVDLEGGGRRPEATVRLASAVRREWLEALFPGAVTVRETLVYDADREAVVARRRTRYLDLTLAESVRSDIDPVESGALLAEAVLADPALRARVAGPHAGLLDRLAFLARAMPELGLPADPRILFDDVVRSCAAGHRRVVDLVRVDLGAALLGTLTHDQRTSLAREAPAEILLPTGRRVAVAYRSDAPPTIAARIQELFGWSATPRLALGRTPLVIQLLAPNQRPVQVTDDLAGFWRTTYFDVRKQLRGRYPKHAWPDDPLAATPEARPGRRSRAGTQPRFRSTR